MVPLPNLAPHQVEIGVEGVATWTAEDPLYERLVGPNQWPSEVESPAPNGICTRKSGLCEAECPGFRASMEV
jgi:hypothetical protein